MSQVEAEDEEPSLLGYTQLPHSITHHLRANCLEDLQPRETWPEQLEDPADFSQINEDDSRFLRENLHIEKDRLSVLLPKLDGRLDYEADLNDLEIKLIKEELPMLTRDYGVNVFDPEWGGLYLEHEFSSCENVDEEADRECLHSPGDFAKDIQLENLVIPEEFNSTNEETFTTALKKKRYRSFDEAKTEIAQPPSTSLLGPVTPQSSPLISTSQRGSNSKTLSVKPKLALQERTDTEDLLLDKDSYVSRKRKRGASPKDLDLISLDIGPQKQKNNCVRDIHNIPSSPPVIEESPHNQQPGFPPTPSTLGRPPPQKIKDFTSDDVRHQIIPHAPKNPVKRPEVVLPEDVQELFSNDIRTPPVKAGRLADQEQWVKANTFAIPAYETPVLVASRKGLPHDMTLSSNIEDQPFQRRMKKTNSSPHFLKPTGKTTLPSCSHFPASMARVDVQQKIPDTGVASTNQTRSVSIPSRTLKPEIVIISDDSTASEDEDLQSSSYKEGRDLSGLAQRRTPKLEYYSKADPMTVRGAPKAANQDLEHGTNIRNVATLNEAIHKTDYTLNSKSKSDTMLTEIFSTADALQNYICLRKGSSLPIVSHHFPVMEISDQSTSSKNEKNEKPIVSKKKDLNLIPPRLSKPEFTIPSGLRYFVVSACFLRNRRLASRVQRLYPGAELIERDFTLHKPSNPGVQNHAGSATQPGDGISDEADIILSPGTGIILTTVQKIRQCSLPGQTVRLIVRERVARVAQRYEKLLILVSEDNIRDYLGNESNDAEPQIIDSDYEAVIDFIGFCSSLKQDTQAIFVVGKEEQLAEWIVAMMAKYGVVDPEVKLIPEETLWEIFLRRAGFNVFAAQAILVKLKDQSTATNTTVAVDSGLAAFIKMSVEKRVERFESLFGGRGLLIRVGACLDARW